LLRIERGQVDIDGQGERIAVDGEREVRLEGMMDRNTSS